MNAPTLDERARLARGAWHGIVTREAALGALEDLAAKGALGGPAYWAKGRGNAVGAPIHPFSPGLEHEHSLWETLFAIPEPLVFVLEAIETQLPEPRRGRWLLETLGAIAPGSDHTRSADHVMYALLTDARSPLAPWREDPLFVRLAALHRAQLHATTPPPQAWKAAEQAAGRRLKPDAATTRATPPQAPGTRPSAPAAAPAPPGRAVWALRAAYAASAPSAETATEAADLIDHAARAGDPDQGAPPGYGAFLECALGAALAAAPAMEIPT